MRFRSFSSLGSKCFAFLAFLFFSAFFNDAESVCDDQPAGLDRRVSQLSLSACTGIVPDPFRDFVKVEESSRVNMGQKYRLKNTQESLRIWCWGHAPGFLITQPMEVPTRLPGGAIVEVPFHESVAKELREPTEKKYSMTFAFGFTIFEIESCSGVDSEQAKDNAILLADEIYSYQKRLPELLLNQLMSRDFREQNKALFILRTLRLDDPGILQQLIQFGQRKNVMALIALSNYPDQSESICPILSAAFVEEDYEVGYHNVAWIAERAMNEIGPAATPFLLKIARTSDSSIQSRALRSIQRIMESHYNSSANSNCSDLLSFVDERRQTSEQDPEERTILNRISELCKKPH